MQFDFLDKIQEIAKKTVDNISEEISKNNPNISETEVELAQKLDAIEEFSIDRLEENIAILENRKDGSKINVDIKNLPSKIQEGDIIKKINGKYILDTSKTINEQERIKNKMDNLWN